MNLLSHVDLLANRKLHDRIIFQGLPVSIENRAGSVRSGVDQGGKPWSTRMTYDYGYLRKTQGTDGDHVDCFIGPQKDAENAYVVHIKKSPDFKAYDEDKVMLGFRTAADAKRAFMMNYNDPRFFGSMDEIPMADFKKKAMDTKDNPGKIAAWGEVGNYVSMAHLEARPTFHPPSLKNPKRMPADDPGETDDTYLDVTKRTEKATKSLRDRIASRKGSDFKNLSMAIRTTGLPWAPANAAMGVLAMGQPLPQSRLWRRKLRERAKLAAQAQVEAMEFGGPGSGCNPEVGKCGRPSGGGKATDSAFGDVGDEQMAVNKAITDLNLDADQTMATHFLGRAVSMGPVNSPERLAEVVALTKAISRVDGSARPGLAALGEAIQYQSGGGIHGTIAQMQSELAGHPSTPEASDIRRAYKNSGVTGALSRAQAVLGELESDGKGNEINPPTRPLKPGETTEDAWRNKETGQWDLGREAFHEAVVDKMVEGKTPPVGRAPIAWVLGGGTASGKTTASRSLIGDDPNILRVDPDEIKLAIPEYAGLKENDPDHAAFRVHEESSYMTKMAMAEAVSRGLDLTYDSTTSGNGGVAMAKLLAANGYDVNVAFVDIPISMAKQRAAKRAAESKDPINFGRRVPDAIIEGSHRGAAQKFFELKDTVGVVPGVKSAKMLDNSGQSSRLIYENNGGQEVIHDPERFERYRQKGRGVGD